MTQETNRALDALRKQPGMTDTADHLEALQREAQQRKAERAAQHQKDVESQRRAVDERREAAMKAELRMNWILSGGRGDEFEANYPALRAARLEAMTKAAAQPAARKRVTL
jgi:hypothetical protein